MPSRLHGFSRGSPLQRKVYRAWWHAIERCSKPNHPEWPRYGGRGITVCDEWRVSFLSFFDHIGFPSSDDLSLDRIDNAKGYSPGNVRWATREEQNSNKRQGNQKPIKTLSVRDEVYSLLKAGYSTRQISKMVDLGKSQIWKISKGQYDAI